MDRPLTIPEIRGHSAIPKERKDCYSAASYVAQYGITVEEAEYLVERCASHREVERRIQAMFSADPELKDRALNWHRCEQERENERRLQVDKEREEARQKKIAEAKRQEAEKEKAKKALAEKREKAES